MSFLDSLGKFTETVAGGIVQVETVRAARDNQRSNSADDFSPIVNGVDHEGNTIYTEQESQIVGGVSNSALLVGTGVGFLVVALVVVAVKGKG